MPSATRHAARDAVRCLNLFQRPDAAGRSKVGRERTAFALQWFERLQAGQIDRDQMTTALSETLTDDSVKEMSRIVTSFGPATKDEIVGNRKIDDQTFYVVKLFLQRGDAVSLLIGFNESGKITGVTFPSLGQE